jgi:hypothetical protein
MTKTDHLAETLQNVLVSPNVHDLNGEPANLVDVINTLAQNLRFGLKWLGNGDASTHFGAIEGHGMATIEGAGKIENGLESVASAIGDLAAAVRETRQS